MSDGDWNTVTTSSESHSPPPSARARRDELLGASLPVLVSGWVWIVPPSPSSTARSRGGSEAQLHPKLATSQTERGGTTAEQTLFSRRFMSVALCHAERGRRMAATTQS